MPSSSSALSTTSTETIRGYILKALSQKGDPTENLKIFRVVEGAKGVDGTPYFLVDFAYQLNTEAGFLIGRRGVMSITSVGASGSGESGYLQGFVTLTTDKRWPKLESTLRTIAESFRVYRLKSGIFAADM